MANPYMQMLIARGEVPGVPAIGHMDGGYWHPGARRNCRKGNCSREDDKENLTMTDHPSPQSSNMKKARDLVVGDRVVLSRPQDGKPVVRTVSRAITNYPLRDKPKVEQTDLRWAEKTPDYVPIGWGGDPDTQFTLAEDQA